MSKKPYNKKKIKIYSPYRNSLFKKLYKVNQNQPSEFFWGINFLNKKNYEIAVSFSKRGVRKSFYSKISYIFEKIFIKLTKMGAPFEVYLENKKFIKNKDIIFCCNDALSFAFLFFKKIRLIDAKIITLFQGLSERRIKNFKNSFINYFIVKSILKYSNLILTLSDISTNILIKEYALKKSLVKTLIFGVDIMFWKYKKWNKNKDFILSVGNDSNRDYKTLIECVKNKYKTVIITKKSITLSNKIKSFEHINSKKLRWFYQNAKITIIPSKKLISESAGMSCIMQSMACGTPVITSESQALKEKFKNKKDIIFYRAESVDSLSKIINKNYNNDKLLKSISISAYKKIKYIYNYKNLTKQVNKHIKSL